MFAEVVGASFGVSGYLGEGDVVDDPVELTAPASVEPVPVDTSGVGCDGGGAVGHSEVGSGTESAGVADLG